MSVLPRLYFKREVGVNVQAFADARHPRLEESISRIGDPRQSHISERRQTQQISIRSSPAGIRSCFRRAAQYAGP